MRLSNSKTSAGRASAVCIAGALFSAIIGSAGCDAARSDGDRAPSEPASEGSDPLAQVSGVNIPDPNGTYFAEVKANGTGCPAGTWNTRIAADGQVFTTTFAAYVASVNPGVAIAAKDCILSIKLHTPEGRSFSVKKFSYSGFALLNPGVIGRQTADYWFQGRPVASPDSNRIDLVGPYDDDYVFTDNIKTEAREWSPCGVERDLNINTRLVLQNDVNRSGYINLSAFDGEIGKVEVEIESRRCSVGEPTQPTNPQPTNPQPTNPPATDPPPTQNGVVKPTNVRVTPTSVRRDQPFTITWNTNNAPPSTVYAVEVHEHFDAGYALVWRSPEIIGSSLTYSGSPLPRAGGYHVVVVARDGNRVLSSDRTLLTVTQSTTPPPVTVPGQPTPVVTDGSKLPAWARRLVGRYAVRTDAYAVASNNSMMGGTQLALADFVETSDGALELRIQPCSQTTQLGAVGFTLRNPDAYPPLRRRVVLEPGERWSTDGTPHPIGFLRDGAPECSGRRPGDYVSKRSEQRWNRSSQCRCSVPGDVPRLDDCRVVDPDRDGQPGLAFDWSGPGSIADKISHAVGVTRSRYVGGRVSQSGLHTAQYVNDEVAYELVCENSECESGVPGRPCTPDFNPAQFVPLPQANLTCADVRARQGTLFRTQTSPRSCTRAELTNAP